MALVKLTLVAATLSALLGCAAQPQPAADAAQSGVSERSTRDRPNPEALPADILTWLEQVCAMAPGPDRESALAQGRANGWEASCP